MTQPVQPPPQPPADNNPYAQQPLGQQPFGQQAPAQQAPGQQAPVQQPFGQQVPAQQAPAPQAGFPQPGVPQPGYGYPQPAGAGWKVGPTGPAAPQGPARPGVGLLAGVLVMIVAALIYGGLLRALSNSDGSYHEFSYAALAVGLAVGAAIGKVGGRHPALPAAGLVLAVIGVFFGEMFGLALIASHVSDGGVSVTDVLFQHFGVLFKAWKSEFDFMSALFYGIAAFEGYVVTKRTSRR